MPEGDALHRIARQLQVLVGDQLAVETPNPRGRVKRLAERLDGRTLESVEAIGKNLVLRFDGGIALRSHLRMNGRWRVHPRGTVTSSAPWLVLRGDSWEAVQYNGPVLTLVDVDRVRRLGPDVLSEGFDAADCARRVRTLAPDRRLGEALQDQTIVAGIGNMWMAEAAWQAELSPWLAVDAVTDDELRDVLAAAARLMGDSLERGRSRHEVYRRAGRPCRRCGSIIASRGMGDDNRTAYWCPGCQREGARGVIARGLM